MKHLPLRIIGPLLSWFPLVQLFILWVVHSKVNLYDLLYENEFFSYHLHRPNSIMQMNCAPSVEYFSLFVNNLRDVTSCVQTPWVICRVSRCHTMWSLWRFYSKCFISKARSRTLLRTTAVGAVLIWDRHMKYHFITIRLVGGFSLLLHKYSSRTHVF